MRFCGSDPEGASRCLGWLIPSERGGRAGDEEKMKIAHKLLRKITGAGCLTAVWVVSASLVFFFFFEITLPLVFISELLLRPYCSVFKAFKGSYHKKMLLPTIALYGPALKLKLDKSLRGFSTVRS